MDFLPQSFFYTLGIDTAIISFLAFGLYYYKHKDLHTAISFCLFNIFLYILIFFLVEANASWGIWIAIFWIIWMVRLRSDTFTKIDITYFMSALTLAIISALYVWEYRVIFVIGISILLMIIIFDIIVGNLFTIHRTKVTLDYIPDKILTDEEYTKKSIKKHLNINIIGYTIKDINYIKECVTCIIYYKV
mgnify:CR=1 FL=1